MKQLVATLAERGVYIGLSGCWRRMAGSSDGATRYKQRPLVHDEFRRHNALLSCEA